MNTHKWLEANPHISQVELARLVAAETGASVNASSVSHWVTGRTEPAPKNAHALMAISKRLRKLKKTTGAMALSDIAPKTFGLGK